MVDCYRFFVLLHCESERQLKMSYRRPYVEGNLIV